MSKAILLSIRPQWVAKILNGEKTIEIRKKFPKDYVGWVYIYCTKDLKSGKQVLTWLNEKSLAKVKTITYYGKEVLGKVVARFWCDKVDEYVNGSKLAFENGTYIFGTNADFETILKPSCLTEDELYDYCEDLSFKAIHIAKLEIFDKPKELSEFISVNKYGIPQYQFGLGTCDYRYLTKAPQNYCYVGVEE